MRYGGALALCVVDRLDPEGYAQTTRAVVRPGPGWPGRGLAHAQLGGRRRGGGRLRLADRNAVSRAAS